MGSRTRVLQSYTLKLFISQHWNETLLVEERDVALTQSNMLQQISSNIDDEGAFMKTKTSSAISPRSFSYTNNVRNHFH